MVQRNRDAFKRGIVMPDNRGRTCPPFAFLFLHACTVWEWPDGVLLVILGTIVAWLYRAAATRA